MPSVKIEILPPEENMRRDGESLLSLEKGSGFPGFRIYRWNRLCLSLGYLQKSKPVNVPVVRRPTGGGALLHGWDISFSITDFKDRWGTKPSKIYRRVSHIFVEIFGELGITLSLEKFRGNYSDRFYCFWVPTFGELTWRGRKVLSMAMRTERRSFLVHGSVYTDFDYEEASRLLGVSEEALRRRIISLKEMGIDEEEFVKLLSRKLSSSLQLPQVYQESCYGGGGYAINP